MKKGAVLVFTFLFSHILSSCNSQEQLDNSKKPKLKDLLVDIREENISEADARKTFAKIIFELRDQFPAPVFDSAAVKIVFPLRGKNYRAVGGRGKGFYARLFNLFDHSMSKSHPAHDIFIYDLNRDCRDDNDGEFVDIVAVNDGIVVATETNWSEKDEFKGGNYVWLYDFKTGGLWYYAHMRQVYALEGQLVRAGDKLGEVGRTGFNAESNRSDTHLHLMFLKIDEAGNPLPVNTYPWLKVAKTVFKTQLPTHFPKMSIDVKELESRTSFLYPSSKFASFTIPLFSR
jgi:peptidoglycan LD-endopeptidase LytH